MKVTAPFFIVITLFLFSCKKAPVKACINTMSESYQVGDKVNFSAACSENGAAYEWDFGDNQSSIIKSPEHIFDVAGTYDVELKVYGKKKKSFETTTKQITVKKLPTQITFVYVTLNSFPQVDSYGNYWTPDIVLKVFDQNTTYVAGTDVYASAVYNQPYTYYQEFPAVLPFSDKIFFGLYDNSQIMEVVEFSPTKYSLSNPASIDLEYNNYSITLQVEWVY